MWPQHRTSHKWISSNSSYLPVVPVTGIYSDTNRRLATWMLSYSIPLVTHSMSQITWLKGCETTSHFLGCGKKTAWASRQKYTRTRCLHWPIVSCSSLSTCRSWNDLWLPWLCSKGWGLARVNEARHRLFTSGKTNLENIPHSQAALFEHVKRALLQASFYKQVA